MSAKSRLRSPAQLLGLPAPKAAVAVEIVTILGSGEAQLPSRRSGVAQNRETQLTALLEELTGEGASLVELNFKKSLEARAPAGIKALTSDLDCYVRFSALRGGLGLNRSKRKRTVRACLSWRVRRPTRKGRGPGCGFRPIRCGAWHRGRMQPRSAQASCSAGWR